MVFCRHCSQELLARKPCPISKWLWLFTKPCEYCRRITQQQITIDEKIANKDGQQSASERRIFRKLFPRRWVRTQLRVYDRRAQNHRGYTQNHAHIVR